MTDAELLALLEDAAAAVHEAVDGVAGGLTGHRHGQYHLDVVADVAALSVLERAGLGVLSEESGDHHPERPTWVALDPVDGSTNAWLGLPWYATSACVVDADGPRVALVVNHATGERYEAVRGEGARRGGSPVVPGDAPDLARAIVAIVGYPPRHLGWWQYRSLGAASLDLCAVAAGQVDAFIDCSVAGHAPWDYLAALLVCREAGVGVLEAGGRDLVVRSTTARRVPVAAPGSRLLDQALTARASFRW